MKTNWQLIGTAKVNQNGGITLPSTIRKKKSLDTGDQVAWMQDEDGQILLISEYEYRQLLAKLEPGKLIMHHLETLGFDEQDEVQIPTIKHKDSDKDNI